MILDRRRRLSYAMAVSGIAIGLVAVTAPATATTPATTAPAASPTHAATPAGAAAASRTSAARIGDAPAGYYFGTDSTGVPVATTGPAGTPALGGVYGGYTGMAGDWAVAAGCGPYRLAWSDADAAAASRDHRVYHAGVGAGAYWFMGGPGVDPHYDATTGEAAAWGRQQAAWALAAIAPLHLDQPVLWMDIELPGSTVFDPVTDNGWTSVYRRPCDAQPTGQEVTPTLARAELDGFAGYLEAHARLAAGVYSDPEMWTAIFGDGPASVLDHTYEWTADDQTSTLTPLPYAWCRPGTGECATFFGGVSPSSPYALSWQWSGGEGTRNGVGDFDTIDGPRTAAVTADGLPPAGVQETTGIAADPTTGGYWLTTAAGNVVAFHAPWFGSPAGRSLSGVVGIAATRSGYVVATASGKAYPFHTPSQPGTVPGPSVVGVAADRTGGFWLVSAGGGVAGFGAPFYGRVRTPAGD